MVIGNNKKLKPIEFQKYYDTDKHLFIKPETDLEDKINSWTKNLRSQCQNKNLNRNIKVLPDLHFISFSDEIIETKFKGNSDKELYNKLKRFLKDFELDCHNCDFNIRDLAYRFENVLHENGRLKENESEINPEILMENEKYLERALEKNLKGIGDYLNKIGETPVSDHKAIGDSFDKRLKRLYKDLKNRSFTTIRLGSYNHRKKEIILYVKAICQSNYSELVGPDLVFTAVWVHELFHAIHATLVDNCGGNWKNDKNSQIVKESFAEYFEYFICNEFIDDGKKFAAKLYEDCDVHGIEVYPYAGMKALSDNDGAGNGLLKKIFDDSLYDMNDAALEILELYNNLCFMNNTKNSSPYINTAGHDNSNHWNMIVLPKDEEEFSDEQLDEIYAAHTRNSDKHIVPVYIMEYMIHNAVGEENRVGIEKMVDILKENYGIDMERKAVGRVLTQLQEADFLCKMYNEKGYWYDSDVAKRRLSEEWE